AELQLKMAPFEDLGFAKLDHHRALRQGVAEVIYGAGKTPEQIRAIAQAMLARGQRTVLITRMSAEAAAAMEGLPFRYDPLSRVGIAGTLPEPDGHGTILIATGGTSDQPVAEEAALTAEALGFNTSSLTALLSVLTLGITLAAEDILGNVAGGLVILSSRPFALGDFIEAGGISGTVREIGLNHTKLETPDGQMVLMPNKDLSSSKIINYTVLGRRRVVRTVTASYDAPTEEVKAACLEAVAAAPGILSDPAPAVQLTNYGASSIEYTIFCWCSVEDYWPVYFAVNENLRSAFANHGVEMTYDHLNVHVVNK
ncbi:MAG: hypothetical protein EGQ09_07265, partial [Clostridiales bacterium]|nr:hypothetical protein [Clostridiales bacterium]